MAKIIDLRRELPPDIAKWNLVDKTMNAVYDTFENWRNKNAQIINMFFDQPYFSWEESLIDKFAEIHPDLKFDAIKDEWINLALIQYNNQIVKFKNCINRIKTRGVKRAFMKSIFDKIQNEISGNTAYSDFATKCTRSPWDYDVLWYLQKIVDYLNEKENTSWAKKTIGILKKITITNDDLNSLLSINQIPAWTTLKDPTLPLNIKNTIKDFDTLLSFEIGEEAHRTIDIANDISSKLEGLFSNTFPAINTIIWENEKYRYDENKLWLEYQLKFQSIIKKFQAITNSTDSDRIEAEKQINELRREYYIKYLKRIDKKIGKALEDLYNNDFDYSKLETDVLKWYLDKVTDLRLESLFKNGVEDILNLNLGNINNFSDFYKKLADPSIDTVHLDDRILPWTTTPTSIDIPIKKSIMPWKKSWLKDDINQFWSKEKSYDYLPIRYEILKKDIEDLDINMEDKTNLMNFLSRFEGDGKDNDKYIIEWNEAWSLIYLYFVINSKTPITHVDLEKQKELENLFWDTKKSKKDEQEKEETKSEKEKKSDVETFINEIEKFWSWVKFKNWVEIRLPARNSELPWWWYQRMKVKVSNVDKDKWTFTWKFFGWELEFGSKLEWKTKEFSMDESTFKILKRVSKDSNKIRLLPNPDNLSFNAFSKKLNGKLGTWDISFPEWVNRDGGKFTHNITDKNWKEKEEEVKFFWIPWDTTTSYKVEYNPSSHSFKVSGTFNWTAENNGKSEEVRYSYSRNMDWNNFLIFFTQKWLIPQTEEEAQKAQIKQNEKFKVMNWRKRKLHRFSLNNLKNVFKTITWNIKKKVDEYNKRQDEKLENILIEDWWLYNKLSKILWFIPSIKQWLWELEQEHYNERDNRSRKEIEKYLKLFQSDPDFWTTFDKIPPFAQILWWKSYKGFIEGLFFAKRELWDWDIQKAAALLLANIEKWWSPYRGLTEYENKWLWVKVLLWDGHYGQFLRDKANCIHARNLAEAKKNSWLDKKWLNEELANCEINYIINNIRGSYWNVPFSFWSKELRWLNWDKSTEYLDNPSKALLSDQFATKLETASKWRFTKSSVEETYSKNKSINRFEIMEDEFWKMWSARYQKWAWALRRMFDLASDESLKNRAKKDFLIFLLSWALDVNCDPSLKKQVYGWAKPMSFIPWMLVKEKNVAWNIAILLDAATNWDFSKNVTKYFHKDYLLNNQSPDFKWLKAEIDNRLTDNKMREIDDYFSGLPIKDFSEETNPEKLTVLKKFQKALLEEDVEELDRGLLDNPVIVNNWLLTNINVVSNRLKIKDWDFEWNDSDDISNKKKFRQDVSLDIKKRDYKDKKTVNFVLNKYLSRFWMNSRDARQNLYKWINTAKYYKDKVDKNGVYNPMHKFPLNGWKDELHIPLWSISKDDINKVLLYALEGNVRAHWLWWHPLPSELKDALDEFQNFFENAFHQWTLYDDYVKKSAFKSWNLWDNDTFLLWGWDQYRKMKEKENENTTDEWDDISNWNQLKPSKKRDYLRTIFKVNYVNKNMEEIYERLKRGWNIIPKDWELSISSNNSDSPQDCQIDPNEKKGNSAKVIDITSRNLSQWLKATG